MPKSRNPKAHDFFQGSSPNLFPMDSANDNRLLPEASVNRPDYAYGPCATYIPDNALSLLGPAIAPSLTECGIEITMPPVAMPTAKARIERFFGTLKSMLKQQPLAVVDMRRAEEHGYEVGEYAILMTQLQDLVDQCVRIHNNSNTTEFDKRTPNQQLEQDAKQNARSLFHDVERLEHHLGVTDQAIFDRNGVMKFGLRWRDKEKARSLLRNLKQALPTSRIRKRKDGSIAAVVKIWYNPGDLSSIKVWDDYSQEWVRLVSTEIEYTHRLSLGAHQLFEKRRKQRNETLQCEDDRLASIARTHREMDEMVPDLTFQQRRRFANLYQSKEVQRVSRRSFAVPQTPSLDREFGDIIRLDDGLPQDRTYSFEQAQRDQGEHFDDEPRSPKSRKGRKPSGTKPEYVPDEEWVDEENYDDELDGINFDTIDAVFGEDEALDDRTGRR